MSAVAYPTYSPIPSSPTRDFTTDKVTVAAPDSMVRPHEPVPSVRAPAALQALVQAAGFLPSGVDTSLVDYQALSARLGSMDPAVLAEGECKFKALLGMLIGSQSKDAQRASNLKQGAPAIERGYGQVASESEDESGADALVALLSEFLKTQSELGRIATTLRSNAIAERMMQMHEAANKIREEAREQWKAGIAQASASIVGGVMQIGLGVYSGVSAVKDVRAANSNSNTNTSANANPNVNANIGAKGNTTSPAPELANLSQKSPTHAQGETVPDIAPKQLKQAEHQEQQQGPSSGTPAKGTQGQDNSGTAGPSDVAVTRPKDAPSLLQVLLPSLAQAVGGLSNGTGQIMAAGYQKNAQMYAAGQKEDEAAAAMAEQSNSDAQTLYGQSLQAASAALQTIQSALAAKVQADRTVFHVG